MQPKGIEADGARDKSPSSPAVVSRDPTNDALTFITPDSKSVQLRIAALKTDDNDLSDVKNSPEYSLDFDAVINNFILGDRYTIALEREVGNLSAKNSRLPSDLAAARREIASLTTRLHSFQPSSHNRFGYTSGGEGCADGPRD